MLRSLIRLSGLKRLAGTEGLERKLTSLYALVNNVADDSIVTLSVSSPIQDVSSTAYCVQSKTWEDDFYNRNTEYDLVLRTPK